MFRIFCLAVVVHLGIHGTACAIIIESLNDEFDDRETIAKARKTPVVQDFAKEIRGLAEKLERYKEAEIERLLGKPSEWVWKTYAMPLGQPRGYSYSGLGPAREQRKEHTEYYSVQDFARVQIHYHWDGITPVFVAFYFKVDATFPKLTETNLDERLAWDRKRFDRLVRYIDMRIAGKSPAEIEALSTDTKDETAPSNEIARWSQFAAIVVCLIGSLGLWALWRHKSEAAL